MIKLITIVSKHYFMVSLRNDCPFIILNICTMTSAYFVSSIFYIVICLRNQQICLRQQVLPSNAMNAYLPYSVRILHNLYTILHVYMHFLTNLSKFVRKEAKCMHLFLFATIAKTVFNNAFLQHILCSYVRTYVWMSICMCVNGKQRKIRNEPMKLAQITLLINQSKLSP